MRPRPCSIACRCTVTVCAGSIRRSATRIRCPTAGRSLYTRDLDRTADSLDRIRSGDGGRWRAFAAPYVKQFDALRQTMLGGFPPTRGTLRLAAGLGPRGMLDFARLVLMPAQALGEELFDDERTRAWLYGSAMHSDVPLTRAGSAIAGVYMNLLGHGVGWPSPERGAGRLADALVSYLQEIGGEVRTVRSSRGWPRSAAARWASSSRAASGSPRRSWWPT